MRYAHCYGTCRLYGLSLWLRGARRPIGVPVTLRYAPDCDEHWPSALRFKQPRRVALRAAPHLASQERPYGR
jgi:hypothetical protein